MKKDIIQCAELDLGLIVEYSTPVDLKLTHTFSDGIYVRQLDIPKNSLVIGKRHRGRTLNMLTKGEMVILDGTSKYTIKAPYTFTSDPYTQKIGYAHEDSTWLNIHITDSTDVDEIERQFIISEEEYKLLQGDTPCHMHLQL